MDDKELHYVTYDPDEMWRSMTLAYIEAGGDVLYPGDEKEIQLRGVQAMFVQAFAGVDNALRMDTLRYAVRKYLDLYGEKRNCYRLAAKEAEAEVEIVFRATGEAKTIEAGTPMTADGEVIYCLKKNVTQTGYAQTITAGIVCSQTGSVGNGLISGTQLHLITPKDAVVSVTCTQSASGGQDEEDDETYRERIRRYGLSTVTTGPATQYESAAMNVTSEIIDANAVNLGAGNVGVYLLLASEEGAEAIVRDVKAALSADDVRPLTDCVTVMLATPVPYTINVQYAAEPGENAHKDIAEAVKAYQKWQDETIGQTFNPDKLMAMLYQAGAMRVVWGEGSHFNDAEVAYTAIGQGEHCSGSISLAVIDE